MIIPSNNYLQNNTHNTKDRVTLPPTNTGVNTDTPGG